MMVGWFPSTIIHKNPFLLELIPIKYFVTVERKVIGFTQRNAETLIHVFKSPLVFLPTSLSVFNPYRDRVLRRLLIVLNYFSAPMVSVGEPSPCVCTCDKHALAMSLYFCPIREKSTCSLFYHSNPISRRVQGLPNPVYRGLWNLKQLYVQPSRLSYSFRHMCLAYARTVLDAWHCRITNKANFLISSVIFISQGCVCASQKRTLCVLLLHSLPHWMCNTEILFHTPYSPGVLGSYAVTSGAATTLPLNLPNAATLQDSSSGVVTPTLRSSCLNLFPSSGITGGN